jgi:hypothetical protein
LIFLYDFLSFRKQLLGSCFESFGRQELESFENENQSCLGSLERESLGWAISTTSQGRLEGILETFKQAF